MSHAPDTLEARKELLVARSALERARIRYELVALRSSPSRLPLPVGLLLGFVTRAGAPGAIGKMAGLLAVVRTVLSVIRMVRGDRGLLRGLKR
jgi:hypothetical protein